MQILLSIDDTDNINTPGSGHLAEAISDKIEDLSLGSCSAISRHQLYDHEDVPYTSHNSAMCFGVEMEVDDLQQVIELSTSLLLEKSAEGSDPGLCVAVLDSLPERDELMEFGARAKSEILSKDAAYGLAKRLGVHLSEHGGTGDGVIGALAGVGLRLQGSDGRFRGWLKNCTPGELTTGSELMSRTGADCVIDESGNLLSPETIVAYKMEKVKTVLWKGCRAIPVVKAVGGGVQADWTTLTKEQVKRY